MTFTWIPGFLLTHSSGCEGLFPKSCLSKGKPTKAGLVKIKEKGIKPPVRRWRSVNHCHGFATVKYPYHRTVLTVTTDDNLKPNKPDISGSRSPQSGRKSPYLGDGGTAGKGNVPRMFQLLQVGEHAVPVHPMPHPYNKYTSKSQQPIYRRRC